jgi:pSer/pThr/pTyr-binding forkhead associated (FHA) protein
VLYGADKKPVAYFPLDRDAMLIGRIDAVSGCFPQIDVSEWVDEATARRVSRKHALLLHVRGSDNFVLRPLPGNTGTQVNAEMCAGADVPLAVGARVILGGAVRFKFEVT